MRILRSRFGPIVALLIVRSAIAHPLGNDSITHFNVLYVLPERLELDYMLDIAENPSVFIESHEMDADKDGEITPSEQEAWLKRQVAQLAPQIEARLDGTQLTFSLVPETTDANTGQLSSTSKIIVPMLGPMGMTYRIVIRYVAHYEQPLGPGEHALTFEDKTYPNHQGLKLVLLEPVDEPKQPPYCTILDPHPPFVSEDNAVFRYEQYDPMNLPDVRRATVRFRIVPAAAQLPATVAPAAPSTQPATRAAQPDSALPTHATNFLDPEYNPLQKSQYQRQAQAMIDMLQGRWGIMLFLAITATAFGWGAAHALMPGHAKTVVAAYLISQRGTYWHAAVLAAIVTVTHTALVVILGLVIWFYQRSNPRLGPTLQLWLGLLAGLLVAGMGLTLAWRAVSGRMAGHHHHHHDHDNRSWLRKLFTHSHAQLPAHQHGHEHASHHQHTHDHAHAHAHPHEHEQHDHPHAPTPGHGHQHARDAAPVRQDDQLSFRLLLVLGITGGIVPCPTATIIMLLGIGANVVGGALYAIAIFSLGLALTLMLIGSLALTSRRYAAKLLSDARHEGELSGPGRRLLLQFIPAVSGLAVTGLGAIIAAHYLCLIQGTQSPFPWIG